MVVPEYLAGRNVGGWVGGRRNVYRGSGCNEVSKRLGMLFLGWFWLSSFVTAKV